MLQGQAVHGAGRWAHISLHIPGLRAPHVVLDSRNNWLCLLERSTNQTLVHRPNAYWCKSTSSRTQVNRQLVSSVSHCHTKQCSLQSNLLLCLKLRRGLQGATTSFWSSSYTANTNLHLGNGISIHLTAALQSFSLCLSIKQILLVFPSHIKVC